MRSIDMLAGCCAEGMRTGGLGPADWLWLPLRRPATFDTARLDLPGLWDRSDAQGADRQPGYGSDVRIVLSVPGNSKSQSRSWNLDRPRSWPNYGLILFDREMGRRAGVGLFVV